MKEKIEMDYKGTKITIDQRMIFLTGGLLSIVALLFVSGEIYPGFVILALASLPYIHEGAHYWIAREHGFTVLSISFEAGKIEMQIPDLMTHRDVMDIALAGEIASGFVYLFSAWGIYQWGRMNNSPFVVLFMIVPAVWIWSWTRVESDAHVAWLAYQYDKAQRAKD